MIFWSPGISLETDYTGVVRYEKINLMVHFDNLRAPAPTQTGSMSV